MSIEGQGHFFTIYFPGYVCFMLYKAKISGERLQDHWSSGLIIPPAYEVYRGYIVFAFSVTMFVCLSVKKIFYQRFLGNYLT